MRSNHPLPRLSPYAKIDEGNGDAGNANLDYRRYAKIDAVLS
jgi:hypothetical protein